MSSEQLLQSLLDVCRYLDEYSETETTLFIIPVGLEGFYDFLNLVEMANETSRYGRL